MTDNSGIWALAGVVITGIFSLIIAFLDKNQRKTELREQLDFERSKLFSDKQRQKSIFFCDQLELFRLLEEKYIEEVVSLRAKLNIEPNKSGSVKNEFRDKVNDEENRLCYKKSDYLKNKSFFLENRSYSQNQKEIETSDKSDEQ